MKHISLFAFLIFQLSLSQNYTEYATGSSTDVITNHQPGICLMGGATESDPAMVWFLNKANGGDVVVLRASGSNGYNNYFYSELGVTINSVTTFVIHNAAGAIDPYVLQKVANAEAIWFAGGDQFNYVNFFKNNAMEDVLNAFINEKQGVIGGTSAGMAILGSAYFDAANGTVTNAQALGNPYHERVFLGYNDFLSIPYLENVITDSHYDDPDRRARHSVFLARYTKDNDSRSFGIACNEYTAVCVDSNGRAYVYGEYPDYEEHAFFLQSNCVTDFEPENCTAGNPLTWNRNAEAIKVYKVPGTITGQNYFDLSDWETGIGGQWQNWHIQNGSFNTAVGTNPECASLSLDENNLFEAQVFPNPFNEKIQITTNSPDFSVEVYDMYGKQIAFEHNHSSVNTASWASGIYFLKLKANDAQQVFKMIKR